MDVFEGLFLIIRKFMSSNQVLGFFFSVMDVISCLHLMGVKIFIFFSFDILSLLNIPYLVCNSSLGYVLGNMSLLMLFPFPLFLSLEYGCSLVS